MSTLTLADLLAFNPAPYRGVIRAWEVLAEQLDQTAGDLLRAGRTLHQHWPAGEASRAAHHRNGDLVRAVSDAYNPVRRILDALDTFTAGMVALRDRADDLIERVGRSGPLSAAGQLLQADPFLDAAVAGARALDEKCAAVVRDNLPDPDRGFVVLGAPPLTRASVAAQLRSAPAAVAQWWSALTPVQQEQALTDFPDIVGRLDGVPTVDRDRANRANLAVLTAELEDRQATLRIRITELKAGQGQLSTVELLDAGHELSRVASSLAGLAQVRAELDRPGVPRFLIGLDPAGDGVAVIAAGNPDTARHTAIWVPGVSTDLSDTAGNMVRVDNLRTAADQLTATPSDVAAVMWLGYDTPGLDPTMATMAKAEAGAAKLDRFVDGLAETHNHTDSHRTAVGHSYGSVAAATAARSGDGLDVEDLVALGSPGLTVSRAAELQLEPGHVWAGAADDDAIAWPLGLAVFGPNPLSPSFKANAFTVDTAGHSAYWTAGSESLENQARIVVGRYGDVSLVHGTPPAS